MNLVSRKINVKLFYIRDHFQHVNISKVFYYNSMPPRNAVVSVFSVVIIKLGLGNLGK